MEKKDFSVTVDIVGTAIAIIEADSLEEARELAENMDYFEFDVDDWDISHVHPPVVEEFS